MLLSFLGKVPGSGGVVAICILYSCDWYARLMSHGPLSSHGDNDLLKGIFWNICFSSLLLTLIPEYLNSQICGQLVLYWLNFSLYARFFLGKGDLMVYLWNISNIK